MLLSLLLGNVYDDSEDDDDAEDDFEDDDDNNDADDNDDDDDDDDDVIKPVKKPQSPWSLLLVSIITLSTKCP